MTSSTSSPIWECSTTPSRFPTSELNTSAGPTCSIPFFCYWSTSPSSLSSPQLYQIAQKFGSKSERAQQVLKRHGYLLKSTIYGFFKKGEGTSKKDDAETKKKKHYPLYFLFGCLLDQTEDEKLIKLEKKRLEMHMLMLSFEPP